MEKTKAQRIMVTLLKKEGLTVIENIQLPGGEADIYLPDFKIVVELDGYFHLSTETQKKDKRKEDYWIKCGYQVFRFRNEEIYCQKEKCLKKITDHIRIIRGLWNESLGAPLKDHELLKKVHRSLIRQEQREKSTGKPLHPENNPEAYFLSLDIKDQKDKE